jgi:hypothetical protein
VEAVHEPSGRIQPRAGQIGQVEQVQRGALDVMGFRSGSSALAVCSSLC